MNQVNDSTKIFGRELANNLQSVNNLNTQNLENRRLYLQILNQHIFDLSDVGYYGKIVNHWDVGVVVNSH